jgi:hypothetical protein
MTDVRAPSGAWRLGLKGTPGQLKNGTVEGTLVTARKIFKKGKTKKKN